MARRAATHNVMKFTKASLASVTVPEGTSERIVWDTEAPGLGLRIQGKGSRSWVIRPPRVGGRSTLFTLGPADRLTLAEARAAARERMAKATLGDDPHAVRKEVRATAAVTIGPLLEAYLAHAEKRLKASSFGEVARNLRIHGKPLHRLPVAQVTRAVIAERLREVATGPGPVAANRTRAALSAFFAWAIGEGAVENNPVTGTNRATDEVPRARVLTDAELVKIWHACRDDHFGRIVRLLLLTGQRRDEVAAMSRDEIDLSTATWRLPAKRTKNGRPHDVPLSELAIEVLMVEPPEEGRSLVFGRGTGKFSGFAKAKLQLDKRAGITTPWRLHDLRRTAATRMADLGVLPHVVEAILNHVSGSRAGVSGIYNRATYATEKRASLNLWAERVQSLIGPQAKPQDLDGEHQGNARSSE